MISTCEFDRVALAFTSSSRNLAGFPWDQRYCWCSRGLYGRQQIVGSGWKYINKSYNYETKQSCEKINWGLLEDLKQNHLFFHMRGIPINIILTLEPQPQPPTPRQFKLLSNIFCQSLPILASLEYRIEKSQKIIRNQAINLAFINFFYSFLTVIACQLREIAFKKDCIFSIQLTIPVNAMNRNTRNPCRRLILAFSFFSRPAAKKSTIQFRQTLQGKNSFIKLLLNCHKGKYRCLIQHGFDLSGVFKGKLRDGSFQIITAGFSEVQDVNIQTIKERREGGRMKKGKGEGDFNDLHYGKLSEWAGNIIWRRMHQFASFLLMGSSQSALSYRLQVKTAAIS